MGNRRILMTNASDPIKGSCEIEGFMGHVELATLGVASLRSGPHKAGKKGPDDHVELSSVALTLAHGPWVADFQQRLYHGKTLGVVTITEVEDAAGDGKGGKTWKKVREITLTEAWMESMSHDWGEAGPAVAMGVEFAGYQLTYGDQSATFYRDKG